MPEAIIDLLESAALAGHSREPDSALMADHLDPHGRSTALGESSLVTGAVITYSDDLLVTSGSSIVFAADSLAAQGAAAWVELDGWLSPVVPILARGDAWIVPLSWVPDAARDDVELDARISDLWSEARSACWYRHGDGISVDLLGVKGDRRPYATELVRTGARRAFWWASGEKALVQVEYGEPIPAPMSLMALHVVPVGWVSDRRPTRPPKSIDLAWSWADVVAIARRARTEAGGVGRLAESGDDNQDESPA